MRSGNLINRITFYSRSIVRDDYGSSTETFTEEFRTRGEVRWTGGSRIISAEEKFYSKSMELTIRYRDDVDETMRVKIDGKDDFYIITYLETIGRNEGLRMTLEKLNL